jgi:thiamine-monophosphate kinase
MTEHTRIARYFAPLAAGEPGSFALTDDAALLTPPAGTQLVITTDSVIEGIHVLPATSPQHFAQKLMRRNLSDLAAMGATPWRYTLNLHTPRRLAEDWFEAFASTLAAEQTVFGLTLVGGDSTSGAANAPIHSSLTCFGLISSAPLRRNGAQAGDDLYVSGTIGDAALGVRLLTTHRSPLTIHQPLITRYHTPTPRLALGTALVGIASAALDISDGLLADITQLCNASGVGARIARDAIPHSPELQHLLHTNDSIWNDILGGGDDYELAFTAPRAAREAIDALAHELMLPLTRIGEITAEKNVSLVDDAGKKIAITRAGWQHG